MTVEIRFTIIKYIDRYIGFALDLGDLGSNQGYCIGACTIM